MGAATPPGLTAALIGLQAVQVAILWTHDLVPLGPLNDPAAVRAVDTSGRLVGVTLVQSVPFTIGLAGSLAAWGRAWPGWLPAWLWISYALLFVGELKAWWWPYFVRSEPERAARYRALFGRTHAFLPERNGITPNTMHVVLHGCTALTLLCLFWVRAA